MTLYYIVLDYTYNYSIIVLYYFVLHINDIIVSQYSVILLCYNCNRRLPITMYSGNVCTAGRPGRTAERFLGTHFRERCHDGGCRL